MAKQLEQETEYQLLERVFDAIIFDRYFPSLEEEYAIAELNLSTEPYRSVCIKFLHRCVALNLVGDMISWMDSNDVDLMIPKEILQSCTKHIIKWNNRHLFFYFVGYAGKEWVQDMFLPALFAANEAGLPCDDFYYQANIDDLYWGEYFDTRTAKYNKNKDRLRCDYVYILENAALKIQRAFRNAIGNPLYLLFRRRLLMGFDDKSKLQEYKNTGKIRQSIKNQVVYAERNGKVFFLPCSHYWVLSE